MQLYIQSASFLALALLLFSPTLIQSFYLDLFLFSLSLMYSPFSLYHALFSFSHSCFYLFSLTHAFFSFVRSISYTLFFPHQRTLTKQWTDSKREKSEKNTSNQQLTKSVTFHLNNTYKMNEKIFRYLHFLNQ